jgi:RNA polymerase sigma-70 factor (family 1)
LKNRDVHIIKGIRAGRESAFEVLFKDYYRPLSVFALRYMSDLELAKEIVQGFFVHLYENRKSIIITNSLESYLYQSVRNRCLNHIRQKKTQKQHLDQFNLKQETSENLEEKIQATELEHIIFQIIASLPPQCQRIFNLSRVKGLSNSEIAVQLDISKRTVETQISNALKALRNTLGDLPVK